MTVAMQALRDGDLERAGANLAPVAYNPHARGLAEVAREAMERIAADPTWRGEGLGSESDAAAAGPDDGD